MTTCEENKIVVVTRRSRLDELIARFNTEDQARFYVEHLGADFSDYQDEDRVYKRVVRDAEDLLSRHGRVQVVDRTFVPNFVFGPKDTVVAIGQDGLVANVLKYLNGQPLIGVNPDAKRREGVPLPFTVGDLDRCNAGGFLPEATAGRCDDGGSEAEQRAAPCGLERSIHRPAHAYFSPLFDPHRRQIGTPLIERDYRLNRSRINRLVAKHPGRSDRGCRGPLGTILLSAVQLRHRGNHHCRREKGTSRDMKRDGRGRLFGLFAALFEYMHLRNLKINYQRISTIYHDTYPPKNILKNK
jgi:hypothetical protein